MALLTAGQASALQTPMQTTKAMSSMTNSDPIGFINVAPKRPTKEAFHSNSMQKFADAATVGQDLSKDMDGEKAPANELALEVSNDEENESPIVEQAESSTLAMEVSNIEEKETPVVDQEKAAPSSFAAEMEKEESIVVDREPTDTTSVAMEVSNIGEEKSHEVDNITHQDDLVKVAKSAEGLSKLVGELAQDSVAFFATEIKNKKDEEPIAIPETSTYDLDLSSIPRAGASSAIAMDLPKVSKMEAVKSTVENQKLSAPVEEKQMQETSKAVDLDLDLSKISNVLTPAESFEALAEKGKTNAESSATKILFSSALGGCYVGMGAMVSLAVAGNSPDLAAADPGLYKFLFAALFPMNLLLAQQCGGMLYTGNTASMMAAVCEKRATFEDMGRILGLSWIGNVVGCGVFAIACKYAGVLEGGAGALAAQTLATKTSYELGPLFIKALFCNWLVCLAVLLSTQAKDMGGKYISIWLPVSTFVSIGFEHSVANMFLLPAGLMSQKDITFATAFFHNLIPVTIGNLFSGSLLVGATMSYLYGSLGKELEGKTLVAEEN